MKDIQIDTVFLPFVYGNTWSEGLNFLNKNSKTTSRFFISNPQILKTIGKDSNNSRLVTGER